ncbi:biotin-dependent carboxyltransferase family protein [Dethiosulfatarculus sandiegensis]|uniref:Allophanate hydrolase n=1 Tax=Dethiosulfatarculus sandiegensis TaxID=1429043 RepID=A0A0D2JRR3_9BACT|nr:biotin-dependent carboxyltransferase family protein [Dethiosulfatarculus sandiegensis]KIX12205.1 allophanate hydrolase [Dethiosulfatarculus sandiegensis]
MNVFKVVDPGPLSLIQDLGRFGYGRYGVPVSGALDPFSATVANLLVGNPANAAVMELTFMGPRLEALAQTKMAVTGAQMGMTINGDPAPDWSCLDISPGDKLAFKPAQKGIRCYLAVAGGFDVPAMMASRSTYVGAKLGGFEGRPLKKGDILSAGEPLGAPSTQSIPPELRPELNPTITLRAILGPQDDYFDQGLEVLFSSEYKVTSKADRMGYRLEGPKVEQIPGKPQSIISEPSLPGAVQIPPDGLPIVLLVEQTVGGYTKPVTVITSDLGQVAQARPGDTVKFKKVDLKEAHQAYADYQAKLTEIEELLS